MWWIALALVLLLVLKLWPRGLWLVLALAFLLGGGVFLWNRHIEVNLAQIAATAQYAPGLCPADSPMRVSFHNNSEKPVFRLLFTLHAQMPGYSSVVTPYTYKQYVSDKIIQPGEGYASCYPIPLLARGAVEEFAQGTLNLDRLEWSVEINKAYFK